MTGRRVPNHAGDEFVDAGFDFVDGVVRRGGTSGEADAARRR